MKGCDTMRNPNGYGSIVKLSGKRRKPFMVRAAAREIFNTDTGTAAVERPLIGCYATRKEALAELAKYNANPYDVNMRKITFAELYQMYYEAKYVNNTKTFSKASMTSTKAAFKNCSGIHNMVFSDLRKVHLQRVIDECPLKHSSLELIKNLFRQMYKYAMENDFIEKDYSEYVTINIPDDDESGVPFSGDELQILWENAAVPHVDSVLIMIYSGFRISAFKDIKINLEEGYFQGGVKTKAGKNRIVPIHPDIYAFVAAYKGDTWMHTSAGNYRNKIFYPLLEQLGILYTARNIKHTPHDCRHTFSWLCDKYKLDDTAKHMLMGHTLGNDVEKNVYGHRTLEELKQEIEKISTPNH